MKERLLCGILLVAGALAASAGEWKTLFDGTSLAGWDGNPALWSVKDGAITGTTTAENPTKGNTFIIYVGENTDRTPVEFGDFELKLEFRIQNHNSGIQYRSFKVKGDNDGWLVGGYQADFDATKTWSGMVYGERFRGILAKRGEKVTVPGTYEEQETEKGKRKVLVRNIEELGDANELKKQVKSAPEWNEYHIIAKGNRIVQKINGVTMSELIDDDEATRRAKGLIAIQLHAGPPMSVQVRNIQIKCLDEAE